MAFDGTTDEIRRRADLAEVIGQYVALRPAGNGRLKACCPFHDEKTPSFYVSQDKGFYKCFGCGAAGDVFKFVQTIENLTFPEARKLLAERYHVALPERREQTDEERQEATQKERLWRIAAAAAAFFREQFTGNGGLQARDYARSRGLSRQTLEKFGIGYAPDAWDGLKGFLARKYGFGEGDIFAAGLFSEKQNKEGRAPEDETEEEHNAHHPRHFYDRFRHRLMFPIWDEAGRVIAFGGRAMEGGRFGNPDAKYLNSPEGPIFHKSNVLFGWHLARPEISKRESVIITEGYMDAIALHEAGFGHTVATLGTALTAQHVGLLRRLTPKFVYLCFDGDSAGMRAALRTAPLFTDHHLDVRVVRFPPEDDPDTYVRQHGAVGLENLLRAALPLARYRLEAAFSQKDLAILAERADAMRAAAEIIADVNSDTEREGYIAWLSDHIAAVDGANNPRGRQFTEAAVRRELGLERKRQEASAKPKWQPKSEWKPKGEWQPKGDWKPGQWKKDQQAPSDPEQEAQEAHEISQTLAATGRGVPSGVVKAEKALLCALLAHPDWRAHILEKLPLEKWTNEVHGEIVCGARAAGLDAEIIPVEFAAGLSEGATSLVGEVMLSQEAETLPDALIINDWIARVEHYWAQLREQEMREFLVSKLQRGEPVTPEEKVAFQRTMEATKRKAPLPPKD